MKYKTSSVVHLKRYKSKKLGKIWAESFKNIISLLRRAGMVAWRELTETQLNIGLFDIIALPDILERSVAILEEIY